MNRTVKVAIAVVVAMSLLAGGVLTLVAFAQTPTPQGQKPGDVFWTTLASKLNLSTDALKSAFRDAAKAVVAQSVKDGKIKQEAADKLDERIDQMPLDRVPLPILPQRKLSPQNPAKLETMKQMLDAAANTLGMSPRDLIQELRDGLTLRQIAQQKGVDPDKLKAAMLAVPYARIDEAVKNGKLTQEKANDMKAKLGKQVDLDKRFQLPGTPPKPSKP
jgi:polyhydroxyalkanoate synthesis regulator phasin